MDLLKAEAGAAVTAAPLGRLCKECRAFVTTLGRTGGVLCDLAACPFPKLSWGVPAARIDPPAGGVPLEMTVAPPGAAAIKEV